MGALQKFDQQLAEAKSVKEIFSLDFVKERFIKNYAAVSNKKDGENRFEQERFAYLEAIADKPELMKVDNFYHMAAIVKAGTTGLSFRDGKLYVIPTGNGLKVQSSPAGKREQFEMMPEVKKAPEAILVMKGDKFTHDVANGKVTEHLRTEKSTTEIKLDNIFASYQRLKYADGEIVDTVVYHDDLVKAKSKSKMKSDQGLWEMWPGEAAKKTATNRAFRLYHKYPDNVILYGNESDEDKEQDLEPGYANVMMDKQVEKSAPPEPAAPAANTQQISPTEKVDTNSGEITATETVTDMKEVKQPSKPRREVKPFD